MILKDIDLLPRRLEQPPDELRPLSSADLCDRQAHEEDISDTEDSDLEGLDCDIHEHDDLPAWMMLINELIPQFTRQDIVGHKDDIKSYIKKLMSEQRTKNRNSSPALSDVSIVRNDPFPSTMHR